jgi:peptide/nickel transport system ATP-binding protein
MAEQITPALRLDGAAKSYPVGRSLFGSKHQLAALSPVSLTLERGELLSVVGESGCGKSTLGKVMALVLPLTEGQVEVGGERVTNLNSRRQRSLRREVQIVHQDPYAALNPRKSLGTILKVALRASRSVNRAEVNRHAAELLELVGLRPVADFVGKFPQALSGGQRQRAVIARALAVNPKVLIADEAVSMIDVSLRQQILTILKDLRDKLGVAVVFITHDLALARYFSADHKTMVMYAGRVVEYGPTAMVIDHPRHPYTGVLRSAVLEPDPRLAAGERAPLPAGELPDLTKELAGCPFAPRCPAATDRCQTETPELLSEPDGRLLACHNPIEWDGFAAALAAAPLATSPHAAPASPTGQMAGLRRRK